MNKIKIVKIDPITEQLYPLYDIVDRSTSDGVPEIFHTLSWSIDAVSLQPILAVAGARGVIKIFNVRAGAEVGMLYGHGGTVCALAFSPIYPNILASASVDHTIRIWNTNLALKPFQTRPGSELGSLHPNWDNPPGQLVTILAGVGGHRAPVCSIAWHPVHPLLASGAMDNEVKIWHLSQPPGIPIDSPSQDSPLSGTSQPVQTPDQPASITHLPVFSSKHLHSHWVDQIIWASASSPILLSKSPIVAKESSHPFAEYASSGNLKSASEVRVWQASVLEDIFFAKSKKKMSEDDVWLDEADRVVGGLDFEIFSSFQVPKPGLNEEEESVQWGLGMCLTRVRDSGDQWLDLAILLGNHPNGVAEITLASLQSFRNPVAMTIHSAETTKNDLTTSSCALAADQGQIAKPNFKALDATEITVRSNHLSVSFLFLLRAGQDGLIQFWKQKQKPIVHRDVN